MGVPVVEATELAAEGGERAGGLLQDHGAVVVRGAVAAGACTAARGAVTARLRAAMALVGQHSTADTGAGTTDTQMDMHTRYFGNVQSQTHRRDLKLALAAPVRDCLRRLLAAVGPTLAAVLTEDAELCELAALCSDPGAGAQKLHPDTQMRGAGSHCGLVTAFLALQDVSLAMGPTEVVPGSNTAKAHAALAEGEAVARRAAQAEAEAAAEVSGREGDAGAVAGGEAALAAGGWPAPEPALLCAGDVLLMDSRCIHRGGANAAARRVLLYCSFQIPNNAPPGSTYSLLEEYSGRFRLRAYERWWDPAADAEAEAQAQALAQQ